jgi:shikimate kinase
VPDTDRPAVVFIGAPGSGKSRIGKRVAKHLDLPFIDTDARIVDAHGPIPDIFAVHGEPHFRTLERAAVERAPNESGVVSLGGGAVLDPHSRAELAERRVVLLTVSADAVASRIANDKRPLIRGDIETWRSLVATREPIYASLADMTVDTSTRPVTLIAEEIAHWIQEQSS